MTMGNRRWQRVLISLGLLLSFFFMGCPTPETVTPPVVNTYTVTFDKNSASATGTMTNQSINKESSSNLTTNAFARSGYVFVGWATTAGGTSSYKNNDSYTMGTANVTLYAVWVLVSPITLEAIPAGRFQRDATVTNISEVSAFSLSHNEITRAQFIEVMGVDPSDEIITSGWSDPVQKVNWYQAVAFCNKLSLAEGLTPVYSVNSVDFSTLTFAGIPTTDNADWNAATPNWTNNGYRLPTEMEWMWAFMGAPLNGRGAGTNTTGYTKLFAGSDGVNAIGDYGWLSANADSKTHPISSKLANELGIFDMSGNVWEWCWDWHGAYPAGLQIDYKGVATVGDKAPRGGGWYSAWVEQLSVSFRGISTPSLIANDIGLRVARN